MDRHTGQFSIVDRICGCFVLPHATRNSSRSGRLRTSRRIEDYRNSGGESVVLYSCRHEHHLDLAVLLYRHLEVTPRGDQLIQSY